MKKQKSALSANRKLQLEKRTISNLDASEMSKQLGGFNANAIMRGPKFSKRTCNTF